MRKLVASLLCFVMVFSMAACGNGDKESKSEPSSTVSAPADTDTTPSAPEKEEPSTPAETPDEDTDDLSDSTLSGKLAIEFKNKIKDSNDINAIAEALSAEEFCGYVCGSMEVEEGFLNGFSEEIKGFKKGVVFMPMIGSIPFVTYIFEADDAEGLKATLLDKADPRWNICTEAKETVCVTSGNYVFFTMCPGEE